MSLSLTSIFRQLLPVARLEEVDGYLLVCSFLLVLHRKKFISDIQQTIKEFLSSV